MYMFIQSHTKNYICYKILFFFFLVFCWSHQTCKYLKEHIPVVHPLSLHCIPAGTHTHIHTQTLFTKFDLLGVKTTSQLYWTKASHSISWAKWAVAEHVGGQGHTVPRGPGHGRGGWHEGPRCRHRCSVSWGPPVRSVFRSCVSINSLWFRGLPFWQSSRKNPHQGFFLWVLSVWKHTHTQTGLKLRTSCKWLSGLAFCAI